MSDQTHEKFDSLKALRSKEQDAFDMSIIIGLVNESVDQFQEGQDIHAWRLDFAEKLLSAVPNEHAFTATEIAAGTFFAECKTAQRFGEDGHYDFNVCDLVTLSMLSRSPELSVPKDTDMDNFILCIARKEYTSNDVSWDLKNTSNALSSLIDTMFTAQSLNIDYLTGLLSGQPSVSDYIKDILSLENNQHHSEQDVMMDYAPYCVVHHSRRLLMDISTKQRLLELRSH